MQCPLSTYCRHSVGVFCGPGVGDGVSKLSKQSGAKRAMVILAFSSCVACSRAEPTDVEPKLVQPKRDQVVFYVRPMTLAAARKSGLPSPLVVLLERDPWAMVVGADSPTFALYEDGTVIQRTTTGFREARLTQNEVDQLVGRLSLSELSRSYGSFLVADSTDQPDQDLLIYRGEKPIFVSVYGSLKDREVRSKLPAEVVAAYDALSLFKPSESQDWLPEKVEVMIWPYEYAPDPSIKWPEKWPGLSDPATVQRGDDSFSIYMPSAELPALRGFLKGRTEKGAVEIGGRKWAASIRFPFPHEKLWMAPHPERKPSKS